MPTKTKITPELLEEYGGNLEEVYRGLARSGDSHAMDTIDAIDRIRESIAQETGAEFEKITKKQEARPRNVKERKQRLKEAERYE